MKTIYNKHEYRQAKAFLSGSATTVLQRVSTPTFTDTTYLINGQHWQEFESCLEFPENDYHLVLQDRGQP